MDDFDLHSRLHLYEKSKNMCTLFLENFSVSFVEYGMLPQSFGLLKLILNLFQTIHIQSRELYLHDFEECTFYIGCF